MPSGAIEALMLRPSPRRLHSIVALALNLVSFLLETTTRARPGPHRFTGKAENESINYLLLPGGTGRPGGTDGFLRYSRILRQREDPDCAEAPTIPWVPFTVKCRALALPSGKQRALPGYPGRLVFIIYLCFARIRTPKEHRRDAPRPLTN